MPEHQYIQPDWSSVLESIDEAYALIGFDWQINWHNAAFNSVFGDALMAKHKYGFSGMLLEVSNVDIAYDLIAKKIFQNEIYFTESKKWWLIKISTSTTGAIVTLENITEKKEARERILIDERNLGIIINITDQPIWLVDSNCNILLCNAAFKKWIFYFVGRELSVGDSLLDTNFEESYLNKFRMCYELALTGKHFIAVEDMMVGNDLKFTTINFHPVHDINNNLTGISCHATDITDQRKSLSQLESQTNLLLEIANIQSHKVRGPVATLLGLVKVFNFQNINDPENIEVMNGVAQVTERLDDIVKEVIRSINLFSIKNQKM